MLPLLDPSGNLRADAFMIANAFMHFPDHLVTALIYFETWKLTAFVPSDGLDLAAPRSVTKWFDTTKRDSINQFNLARLVGSLFLAGAANGQTQSLRKVVYLVQKVIDQADPKDIRKLPRDDKNIREAFRRFKPSIHLILAMHAMSNEDWDKAASGNLQSQRTFFSLAAQAQGLLLAQGSIADWCPWSVDPSFFDPKEAGSFDDPIEFTRYLKEYTAKPDRD